MADRRERNTAVLVKMESVYGTDPVPVPGTDAILLRKFTCKQEIKYVNNPEVRPYMGKGSDLVGATYITGSFEVALAGSGAGSTPPMWGRFLRGAAFAETVGVTPARVDYTLITTALESATLYYYDDGVLKKGLGMRCNITGFKMGYGDVPTLAVAFIALDGGDTAVATPALTLTAWKTPLPVNQVNSSLLTIGCAYSAGALVSGVTFPSKGIEVSLGGSISFIELLGGEAVDFADRDVSGKITMDLTTAQEITNMGIVKAGTTQGIGLLHGTAAGYKLGVFLPACQLKNPAKDTINGKRVVTYDLNAVPVAGNDEWRIWTM